MPIYEYECRVCAHVTEHMQMNYNRPTVLACAECGADAKPIISGSADRREWEPYWDENLGHEPVLVTSRAHRAKLKKERDLQDQYHHKRGCKGQWV